MLNLCNEWLYKTIFIIEYKTIVQKSLHKKPTRFSSCFLFAARLTIKILYFFI